MLHSGSWIYVKKYLFLRTYDIVIPQLSGKEWLIYLAFMTDLFANLYQLNTLLQGKCRSIMNMVSAINTFMVKLQLCTHQIQYANLLHVPILKSIVPIVPKQFNVPDRELSVLNTLHVEFEVRFSDIKQMDMD